MPIFIFLFTTKSRRSGYLASEYKTKFKWYKSAVVFENNSVIYIGLHLNWQCWYLGHSCFFYINRFPQSLFNKNKNKMCVEVLMSAAVAHARIWFDKLKTCSMLWRTFHLMLWFYINHIGMNKALELSLFSIF